MIKFIAEVSSNHNKDINRCLRFIDVAKQIGCDAVKFQLFKIDELFAPEILSKSSEHRRRKEWELPHEFLPIISNHCKKIGIEFGCTPFFIDAVDILLPYVDFFKIASYELLWDGLLDKCAKTGLPIILSTGMANMLEINNACKIILNTNLDLTLLHCNSAYPTPVTHANLAAIETLRSKFNLKVGWSDHSVNKNVIKRAIYKWDAEVIEFHLDLDEHGEEFESGHCWLPDNMQPVIADVRALPIIDGDGIKEPSASEMADRNWRADPIDGLRPISSIRSL